MRDMISFAAALTLCTSFMITATSAFSVSRNLNVFSRSHSETTQRKRFGLMVVANGLLSLELEKPLGIILEENVENEPKGVKVEALADSGSAYASKYRDELVGLKLAKVNGENVLDIGFDDVMEKIIDSPSPVLVDFEFIVDGSEEETESEPSYQIGQTVTIQVIQDGVETKNIEAKVGQNLRKTLLENNVELYRGLKKKIGNCGGAGSCTFCTVDFVESEGWEKRSDYEESRVGKYPTARLACMNNIQGPATIRVE